MTRRGVTGGNMSYVYDAGGTMVKRTNADGSSTVYIGGIFEKTFSAAGIATGTTKYYSALGRTLAVRAETGGGAGTLSYLLADHLGSTVAALDSSGGVVAGSQTKYWPYGATRSGGTASPQPTDQMYTGQRLEPGGDALGLYNYRARMYSTVTGRFVSVDPIIGHPEDPQSWNPYSYVRNNPIRRVDPSGRLDSFAGIVCGAHEGCEGGNIFEFKDVIEAYWKFNDMFDGWAAAFGNTDGLVALMGLGLKYGSSRGAMIDFFGTEFYDTNFPDEPSSVNDLGNRLTRDVFGSGKPINMLLGHSFGAAVVADYALTVYEGNPHGWPIPKVFVLLNLFDPFLSDVGTYVPFGLTPNSGGQTYSFHGKTYGDLNGEGRPIIVRNGTNFYDFAINQGADGYLAKNWNVDCPGKGGHCVSTGNEGDANLLIYRASLWSTSPW